MTRAQYIVVLVVAAFTIAGLTLGAMAQASLTAVGAIVGAVAVWKTKKHYGVFNRFWNWQIAVSGALTAAGIARSVSLMTGQGVVAQGAAAGFVMVAGALATSAVVSMTRLRSRHSRTSWATVADAFLITAAFGMVVWTMIMVPYFSSEVLSRTQIVFAVTLSSMAIVQFALTVFTMLSGGRHNVSWNVLIVACIAALGGLFAMLLEVTGIIAATNYSIAVAFLTAAAGLATAAAFHPDMRTILDAVTPTHRTSPPRLFALALAVLTPPVTIVITTTQTRQLDNVMWLGPSWAAITALLMFRFGEMIYARERSARLERILAVGASRLGNCTTRNEICELTANIILELAERESGVRAAVVTRSADGWLMTALPASAHRFPDEATFELLMEAGSATRGFLPFEDATGPSSLETTQGVRTRRRNGTLIADAEDLSDDVLFSAVNSRPLTQEPPRRRNGAINAESWIGVRYLAKNQPMGVLLLVSDMQLSHAVEDAMASLANNVSLALEAASLSEHLHLQRSDRRFRALVEHSRDVIVVINAQGKTSFRSPAAEELFSRHAGHEQLLELLAPGDRQGFYELIRDVWSGNRSLGMVEGRIEVDENTTNWYEFTITDMRENDEIGGLVINGRDITERKSLEADLRHRAMHDDLTALPNRAYLRGRLGRAMAHSSRTGGMVAAMFIDLDDFKVVNDGLGHEAGDELLRVIAFRLSSFVRETDTPARLGGDEFAVLFEGFENADQLVAMASRLLNVIIEPVNFSGRDIVVGASIGIAISDGAQDPEALLRNADVAMYHAKWGGKNRVQMFEEHMSTAAVDRLEIKADLAHMLDRDELHAYYQPIVRLRDRHVHGFESLARWIHPRRGLVPPDSFIPMTETSGLIVPLGNAILQKSLEQLVLWQRESTDQLSLSVNMSPRQLLESGFVGHVENLLDTFEIDPRWLTMELTESEVLTDSVARRRLTDLGKLGVGIAADDFGSGFASYASLVDLPFTTLKIDRTMLMQIDREPQRTEMQLRSILDMAATLGLKVIAEGVETSAQEDLLLALGCDFAQGYFFGRPAPAASWRVTGAVEGS